MRGGVVLESAFFKTDMCGGLERLLCVQQEVLYLDVRTHMLLVDRIGCHIRRYVQRH